MGICIKVFVEDSLKQLNVVVFNEDSKRDKTIEDRSMILADFNVPLKLDDNRNDTMIDCIEEKQLNQDNCGEIINSEDNCANMNNFTDGIDDRTIDENNGIVSREVAVEEWYGKYVTVGDNSNSVGEQEIPLQFQTSDLLTVSGSNRSNTKKLKDLVQEIFLTDALSSVSILKSKEYTYERLSCDKCPLNFLSKEEFEKHCILEHPIQIEIKDYKWHCTLCRMHFSTKQKLKEHHFTRRHNARALGYELPKPNANSQWKCTVCRKHFSTKQKWKQHFYTRKHAIKVHQADHPAPSTKSVETHWRCTTCNVNFSSKQKLKQHLVSKIHSDRDKEAKVTNWRCHSCKLYFCNKQKLTQHFYTRRHARLSAINAEQGKVEAEHCYSSAGFPRKDIENVNISLNEESTHSPADVNVDESTDTARTMTEIWDNVETNIEVEMDGT